MSLSNYSSAFNQKHSLAQILRKQRKEFWENAGKNDEWIRGTLFSWSPVLDTFILFSPRKWRVLLTVFSLHWEKNACHCSWLPCIVFLDLKEQFFFNFLTFNCCSLCLDIVTAFTRSKENLILGKIVRFSL